MKKTAFIASILAGTASIVGAATFYTPTGVTSANSVAFFPITRLHEGSPTGYSATPPHSIVTSGGHTWVTDAPNGGLNDYYANGVPAPILVIDLGADLSLTEISTWGYATGNTNGARDFDLRFATELEGTGGFGTSIPDQNGFTAALSDLLRDSHPLTAVTARYVEMTITDNWRGFVGGTPGGDRVGLGEIAFAQIIPEPGSFALLGLAGAGFLLRRKRR